MCCEFGVAGVREVMLWCVGRRLVCVWWRFVCVVCVAVLIELGEVSSVGWVVRDF